jgi:aerobic carbon-monoxide dehydrogenase large subunit
MGPFSVGQPVPRTEDPILLRGKGNYTADKNLPGQAHLVVVRSRHAHGVLLGIDTEAAAAMPGVLGIFTQDDLDAAGIKNMVPQQTAKHADGTPMPNPPQTVLARGKVRYVGEPVALVVAETMGQARDAAEAVLLDIDALPAATSASTAAAEGAQAVHGEAPDNIALYFQYGDSAKVAKAFAQAAHVTTLSIRNNRVYPGQMEPRSAVGVFDPASDRYTLYVGCQGVFGQRNTLKTVLGVETKQVRVLTGNVGGSFGMKASCYPEYIAVLFAARALGRPVKWLDDRSDAFLSDSHGRDHEVTASLALDAEGRFLALRANILGNLGAWLSNTVLLPASVNTVKNIIGVYTTPLLEVTSRLTFSNTTPVGAYRGAGRPESNYYMERLIDTAAREMGIDRVELRRRNQIQPEQLPYEAPSNQIYDSGDFPALLDEALTRADWDGFRARRAESRSHGRLRGVGIGQYLEATAPSSQEMGGIRFEPDGTVTIITGTLDYGQGHASTFAQILTDHLGVPFERIRLLQGDSDELLAGGGTGGSRSTYSSGTAIIAAAQQVIERGRQAAASLLEAAAADIEFDGGTFRIAGTDRAIGIVELAARVRAMPAQEGLPESLDVSLVEKTPPSAFPNGCHVAEVEIDPETGEISLQRYETVNDFGNLINPMLVQGQLHGGIMQGLGQALLENMTYDEDGQVLTGSFMDYAMPRADNGIGFGFASHPVPARTNILGVKGCGEAGCAGSLPAIMNAVVDALSERGIHHIDMPATPHRVWQALQAAPAAGD